MAGKRQSTDAIIAKGKKHLTKAEIEERKQAELVAPADHIEFPKGAPRKYKQRFDEIVTELLRLGENTVSNLDSQALFRLVVVERDFLEVTKQLTKTQMMKEVKRPDGTVTLAYNSTYENLQIARSRLWQQCRQGAADFGLTMSARFGLVAPKKKEQPVNKFLVGDDVAD